jgi:SM-20-related protein
MFLNKTHITDAAISTYRSALRSSTPNHIVIDGLFNEAVLDAVLGALHQPQYWQRQRHTYSELYVDNTDWLQAQSEERFVQRDMWQAPDDDCSIASDFIAFLRSDPFMAVLSRIFRVHITDIHVADPSINTNYFRLSADDFVEQHADDSPGREVCLLLYLNKNWESDTGGELEFLGQNDKPISISPLYNRCVLFAPASTGAEHWVRRVRVEGTSVFRYNVTSWYWTE